MRNHLSVNSNCIFAYSPGEPMLESDRLPTVLQTLDDDLYEAFKPEKGDFKALTKGLKFLKFDKKDAELLFDVFGTTFNVISSAVFVVNSFSTAVDLLTKIGILDPPEDPTQIALKALGQRVEQIYGYLANQNRNGLYSEAIDWRSETIVAGTRIPRAFSSSSRALLVLEELIDQSQLLDLAIIKMLDEAQGNIAFLRTVYGYESDSGHWVDAADAPFMTLSDGTPINYRTPSRDLTSEIWDAGHYLDVLLSALQTRMALALAIDPAFRSTGFHRKPLGAIAVNLTNFRNKWRSSLIIANPAAGINGGGQIQNPTYNGSAPEGIALGAVDPVTGISSFTAQWNQFDINLKRTYIPGSAWGGTWDESRAKDWQKALKDAVTAQAAAIDQVVKACGLEFLDKIIKLYNHAASPPLRSDFVKLPDATYKLVPGSLVIFGGVEDITLGGVKVFAVEPNKIYVAKRYHRDTEKSFRFRMARRTDVEKIQLGYRLRISGRDIELCPFSTPAAGDIVQNYFPDQTIEIDLEFSTSVFDCCQSRSTSANDENIFEETGKIPNGSRLFRNERKGLAKIAVSVVFQPFAEGMQGGFIGEAIVTIRNLLPFDFKDAFILDVEVMETHMGPNDEPREVIADSMTIHMVPSYLMLSHDYFDDLQAAEGRADSIVKDINKRFSLRELVPGPADPDPVWATARPGRVAEKAVRFLETAVERHPRNVNQVLESYEIPKSVEG